MGQLENRLSRLSPGRQRLVQQLLDARSRPPPAPAEPPASDATRDASREDADPKRSCRRFFDHINQSLDGTEFGRYSLFLNFGYAPIPGIREQAAVDLPQHVINKPSVKLVLEVVGCCRIDDRWILDVGCGRGGTATVLDQFFRPRRIVGVDLSGRAVAVCRRQRLSCRSDFLQGDAERLPFPAASTDVVLNIESSQSYPNLRQFYAEVHRVLAGDGDFLYADVLPVERASDWIALLQTTGFRVEADRDITPNVLRSCDEVARQRMDAYTRSVNAAVMDNFLGAPGSHVYEEMKAGRWTYRIVHLRKARS